MGETCAMHGRYEKFLENIDRENSEDEIRGRRRHKLQVILKCIL
jgi:hypothetical protein